MLAAAILFTNGVIVTMNPAQPIARAALVKDGAIAGVGSAAEMRKLAPPDTAVRDLGGKTMLPGFYAAHDHFPAAGNLGVDVIDLNSPPVGPIRNIAAIVAAIRAKADSTPEGQWITGRGYDDTLLAENRHPTRADLDKASTRHPIWITHVSGHLGAANSLALQLARVTRDTPKPASGVIRKDASGEPSGVIEEAMGLVGSHVPAQSAARRMAAIRAADRIYLEQGVTTTVIAGNTARGLADLASAAEQGLIHLRIVSMFSGRIPVSVPPAFMNNDRLRLGAIKLSQDGSIQGFTGYLSEPYFTPFQGDAKYRGYPVRSREVLAAIVKTLHGAGRQIAIHGNGDAAIDDILYAYREAQRANPRAEARHRIEHCQTAREDQLDAMKALGITPSFFVGHVYYWGDRHRDIFLGPARGERISPLASAKKRGIRFTLHDDTPVTPVNPLKLVWGAANRLTRDGREFGPAQRISVMDALRAVTIDAAWQNREEARKGSIEPGKLADFAILSANPLDGDPRNIDSIAVVETIVAGQTVSLAGAARQ